MSGTNNEINELPVINQPGDNGNALQGCLNDILNNTTPKDYHTMLLPAESKTGSLPSIALFDSQAGVMQADTKGGDVPPPPEIKPPSTDPAELAKDGIKTHEGPKGKETELPGGWKVQGGAMETGIHKDGRTIDTEGAIVLAPADAKLHQDPKHPEVMLDQNNKPVLKNNEDGSQSVYTEKGVYTVNPDGSIYKETAIKNRDGSWDVQDVRNPLGNMKVPNLAPVDGSKRH